MRCTYIMWKYGCKRFCFLPFVFVCLSLYPTHCGPKCCKKKPNVNEKLCQSFYRSISIHFDLDVQFGRCLICFIAILNCNWTLFLPSYTFCTGPTTLLFYTALVNHSFPPYVLRDSRCWKFHFVHFGCNFCVRSWLVEKCCLVDDHLIFTFQWNEIHQLNRIMLTALIKIQYQIQFYS